MPTILRRSGLRVIIWPDDHAPPHVHVFSATGSAKIELREVRLVRIADMTRKEAARALELVFEHREILLDAWESIHGPSR